MGGSLITPTKVTAWLDCPHYLTLRSRVDDGSLPEPKSTFGSFAELVMEKGRQHEQACLDEFRRDGKVVFTPEDRHRRTFEQWVADVGDPFTDGEYDVVYQMPFVHEGMRGVADFVVRVTDPATGAVRFDPVDAKLVRTEAKPGHVLQLCFYADAIAALTGVVPEQMHVWLGSGQVESLRVNDFRPYWRRLRMRLSAALESGPEAGTVPLQCGHCEFCEFNTMCEEQWRREDSLIYVAGIRRPEIDAFEASGIATLTGLAAVDSTRTAVDGVRAERLTRLSRQSQLQRLALEQEVIPFYVAESEDDETEWGLGLAKLPAPDDGDVFIDFEGHPLWRPETGLFFLFGLLEQGDAGGWEFRAWWAHEPQGEIDAAGEFIAYLAARRERFPGMHAYHYNHTERSTLQRLADGHPVAEATLKDLVDTGGFVDVYAVGLNGIQIGAESYSLKCMEKLTDFERSHEIDKGAGAVLRYERYMAKGEQADLDAIAAYNEDDVRATRALRDWLVDNRPPGTAWRPAYLEPEDDSREWDETVAQLHAMGGEFHFLGDVLGYWYREWLAYKAPKLAKLAGDSEDHLADAEIIGGLVCEGEFERVSAKTGKPLTPGMRFSFPTQELGKVSGADCVLFATDEPKTYFLTVERLDSDACDLHVLWNDELRESGAIPRAVALHDWVDPKPKALALQAFGEEIAGGSSPDTVTMGLLRRDLPRFDGPGPGEQGYTAEHAALADVVVRLDRSYLAVQGPPGTGKTYTAAHIVHALVRAGKRVGITAVSHPAIDNLLAKTIEVFRDGDHSVPLNAVRKGGAAGLRADEKSTLTIGNSNKACAKPEFNLIAGTTWLFASKEMRACPVDVMVVDEAGQMALADTLAASLAAHNLLLVGDPLQLPQVTQASHPGGSGRSVLEHILGEETTMPADRGAFLDVSRRMHRDVCGFISEQIYDGRLSSHPDCARQATAEGTGLRWLRAEHTNNTTASPEEADLVVAEIRRLFGKEWTDQNGTTKPLRPIDFTVVTPYNDQRRLVEDRLGADPETAGVEVGTVDKFQGQEAAVVFFSMATSGGEDITHGKDFLFSRNRLNVAISRARCLAYLVCTEELLYTRARTVEEMRLIATLNAFVEWAGRKALVDGATARPG